MAADILTMPDRTASGNHLAIKMARVMGQINRVPKNGFNKFFGYAYASESDITDAVRGLLADQNVFVFSSVRDVVQTIAVDTKGKTYTQTILWVDYTFSDGESGETMTVSWPGEGHDSGDKSIPKALTTATKYFLLKTFLIPTGDDPEADSSTDERTAGKKAGAPPTTVAPAVSVNPLTALGLSVSDQRALSSWIGQGKPPKDWSTPQINSFKELVDHLAQAHQNGVGVNQLAPVLAAQVAGGVWTIAAHHAALEAVDALKEATPSHA